MTSDSCCVTVILMSFDKQSNAHRMAVESKSNRSCNHRITVARANMMPTLVFFLFIPGRDFAPDFFYHDNNI